MLEKLKRALDEFEQTYSVMNDEEFFLPFLEVGCNLVSIEKTEKVSDSCTNLSALIRPAKFVYLGVCNKSSCDETKSFLPRAC